MLTDALMHAKVGLLEVGNDVGALVGLADIVGDIGALVGLPVIAGVRALDGLPVGALEGLLVGDEVGPIIFGLDFVGLGVGAAEFAVQRDTPYWLL